MIRLRKKYIKYYDLECCIDANLKKHEVKNIWKYDLDIRKRKCKVSSALYKNLFTLNW